MPKCRQVSDLLLLKRLSVRGFQVIVADHNIRSPEGLFERKNMCTCPLWGPWRLRVMGERDFGD